MRRPWQQDSERRPWQPEPVPFGGDRERSKEAAFYNSKQWITFRAWYWLHHPRVCVVCGRYANILDHITPINNGGARVDINNVQGLCHRHHNAKHNREKANAKQDSKER